MQTIPFLSENHALEVITVPPTLTGPQNPIFNTITMLGNASCTRLSGIPPGLPGMFNLTFRGVESATGSITVTSQPTGVVLPVAVTAVPQTAMALDLSILSGRKAGLLMVYLNMEEADKLPDLQMVNDEAALNWLSLMMPHAHIIICDFTKGRSPQTFNFGNISEFKAHSEAQKAARDVFRKAA